MATWNQFQHIVHRPAKQSSGSNSAFSTKRLNSSEYITAVCGATLASVVTVNLSSAISRENTADSPVPCSKLTNFLYCANSPADLSICLLYLSQLCEKNTQKSASYCPACLQHPLCTTAPLLVLTEFAVLFWRNFWKIMAARNVSGGGALGGDSDSDTEVTTLTGAASKPYVNYGDRMPYRQGMFSI
jgi:hypothetical protein